MALRPIDNALPISPDNPRLKKHAKVSIQTQKRAPEVGVNDENKAPLPQPVDASVDYIASENLKPFEDPESNIQSLVEGLDSKDWVTVCESLNFVRRFAIYHSDLLLPVLEKVILVEVKAMKNPRSALCKTSIMAASDIFGSFGEKMLDSSAFDQLLLQLLLKASQDKKFVCEEADKSLTALVNSIAPLPLLQRLHGFVNHGNLRVRAKAAVSISNSVSKMGSEEIGEFRSVSLLQIASDLLNDRLPEAREAREAARSIVFSVYKTFMENEKPNPGEAWQSFCETNLTTIQAQSMIKVISSSSQ
ncbi:LOW QUALITY PROTEIN: TOG array regulator of axonemal microtubules protein 1-like [Hibiscus syriacus]|uniref:LOW QUALITY PROTEIN: TOG array regulator of axonemal microtubules protein 1-like n=1 Tax=Hibiscus syriacus TaxID=106335 RepID=UPI0019208BB5|nr:LOW QUALITY PROTEIN: TOG array regulator of axonemal microtubules protein 1-like [Hibiscus syriacus]